MRVNVDDRWVSARRSRFVPSRISTFRRFRSPPISTLTYSVVTMTDLVLGILITMNDHGQALLSQGRAAEAVTEFRIAADRAEAELGAGSPSTAMILRNLALAYRAKGLPHKAEAAAARSLQILEASFGADDQALVPALNALGEALAAQGRWTEARKIEERAVRLNDPGPHGATALHNLGAVLYGDGKRDAARSYYSQALARRMELFGENGSPTKATRSAIRDLARPRVRLALHQ